MAAGYNTNISSLKALRQLSKSSFNLSESLSRLSSGLRITKAADDAAGLAVSLGLNVSSRVFGQAVRNVNDGLSALTIAQSGLENLSSIVMRQRELAQQAANGSLTAEQRNVLNLEANALVSEYNRTIASTSFNGLSLLNPSFSNMRIQQGFGVGNSIEYSLNQDIQRLVGSGSFTTPGGSNLKSEGYTDSADVDGDGKLDIVYNQEGAIKVQFGLGDGTFSNAVEIDTLGKTSTPLYLRDMDNDGLLDIVTGDADTSSIVVLRNGGGGSFSLSQSYTPDGLDLSLAAFAPIFNVGDFNGDGIQDIVSIDSSSGGVYISLLDSGGAVGKGSAVHSINNGLSVAAGLAVGDVNGDGRDDLIAGTASGATVLINKNDATYFEDIGGFGFSNSYANLSLADLNGDGKLDLVISGGPAGNPDKVGVFLGLGDGTFNTTATSGSNALGVNGETKVVDIDGDGALDILAGNIMLLGNGDGTFKSSVTVSTGNGFAIETGDFNGDGIIDVINNGILHLQAGTGVTTQANLDLSTVASARSALETLEALQNKLGLGIGRLGAGQSRLATGLETLHASQTNYAQAASRITDADIAAESAKLLRSQILQQVSTSILAQANLQPQITLALLQS